MHRLARKLLGRFTYANVMSTLAVVLVIGGGTAYAANTIGSADIIDNSILSADLKSSEVKTGDIANGHVTNLDLGSGAVTSAKILDESLTYADLATNSVGSTEIGYAAVGPDELDSGAVPSQIYTRQASTALDTATSKEITKSCDFLNDKAIGGGFVISGTDGANVPNVTIQRSYAVNTHTWLVRAVATSGTPNWQITVLTTCAY